TCGDSRLAAVDRVHELLDQFVERLRRLPERRMPGNRHAMALAVPEVREADSVEVVELDQWILASVDHGDRDGAAFDSLALIDASPGARRREEPLTEASVRAVDRVAKKAFDRLAEHLAGESFNLSFVEVSATGDSGPGRADKALLHLSGTYGRSSNEDDALEDRKSTRLTP